MFIRDFSFPLIARREGLPGVLNDLKMLNASQYFSPEQLHEIQFKKLKQLLAHASAHVPYYQAIFKETGFSPSDLRSFDDFKRLPILTKSTIRTHGKRLLAKNFSESEVHISETGGTTGIKMRFYRNNSCLSKKEAALLRFEQWSGWDIGERMGLVWPAQQDYVGHWTVKSRIKNEFFRRQIVLPAAVLDKEAIADYVMRLKIKRPTMIRAFVSPLHEVARYILENQISGIAPKGLITTGEPLYDHQRQEISQAFGCPVFDSYRCREVGPIAQECDQHNGMHLNSELIYLEVMPPEDGAYYEPGIGELVVTDLLNYGMPFIRYSMGDMGAVTNAGCPCGRGMPRIQKLAGRSVDQFITPSGKRIASSSLVLYLLDEAPGDLGQVQIIQDRIDRLIIRYTPDPPLSNETKQYQKSKIQSLFGQGMTVSFEQVQKIENERSGKYMFTKCLVTDDEKQIRQNNPAQQPILHKTK